jgi:hypothetical protein
MYSGKIAVPPGGGGIRKFYSLASTLVRTHSVLMVLPQISYVVIGRPVCALRKTQDTHGSFERKIN